MLTVAIVEDHPVFREALRQLLSRSNSKLRITEVESFDQVQAHLKENPHTDLMLLDLEIPGAQGFSALAHVHYHYPHVRIAVVSGHDDPEIIERSLHLGAEAFVPKALPLPKLIEALEAFLSGNTWQPSYPKDRFGKPQSSNKQEDMLAERVAQLTPQQRRVVMGMAQGRLNKQIAYELGITEGTVKNHVTSILRQLSLRRRTEVVAEISKLMQLQQTRSESPLHAESLKFDENYNAVAR